MSDPILIGDAIVGDPVLVALVTIIPTIILGVLGYRRAGRLDKLAAASAGTPRSAEIQQIIDGQNAIIANQRAELQDCRAEITRLKAV